ncbi:MAG: hypothetical protein A2X23_06870 [Chloroflexi bacterium GWC2_73_18]|nr:MAG: hypothetical protein A2X23_06870 [Chloroflexi bacterium GWC2_73_18]
MADAGGEATGRLRVAVLLGGPSAEHDVSLVSGAAIVAALPRERFAVQRVEIGWDGRWSFGPADLPAGEAGGPADGPWCSLPEALSRLGAAADVVFIALHGPFGEDGTIQAVLEAVALPYTGAGVAASALGMDKGLFKRLVGALGLPVVPFVEVREAEWRRDRPGVLERLAAHAATSGDERLMVKPACLGSSVGMTLAHDAAERPAALDAAFRFGGRALVEAYVANARELEVAVLGSDEPAVFGPGEIFPGHEFYDYSDKYLDGASRTAAVADVDAALGDRIRGVALAAYRAIGCAGMARVDFLVPPGGLYLSELNTIPGFTPISLYPKMVEAGGVAFPGLCARLIDLALERRR